MPDSFRIGEFLVEPSLHSVRGPAGTVRLEPKVMQVLLCLAEHGDQVVPKERLMRAVWPDTFVSDDVLTRAISELRRVFGDDVRDSALHPDHPEERLPVDCAGLASPVRATMVPRQRTAARTDTLQSTHDGVAAGRERIVRASVLERRCAHGREAWRRWRVVAAVLLVVSSASG